MSKARIEQKLVAQSCRYCVGLCFLGLVDTVFYLFWGALEKEIGEEGLKWIVWEWVAMAAIVFVGVILDGVFYLVTRNATGHHCFAVFYKITKTCFCEHYDMSKYLHLDSLTSQRQVLLVEDAKINRIILRKVVENLNLHCEERKWKDSSRLHQTKGGNMILY
ncbi:hypothetical protein SUGI_1202400 [Cryptomeria japonica]|nr:hypothetical protein SUGI_1202400 [Cryptomeria japonica]